MCSLPPPPAHVPVKAPETLTPAEAMKGRWEASAFTYGIEQTTSGSMSSLRVKGDRIVHTCHCEAGVVRISMNLDAAMDLVVRLQSLIRTLEK